MLKEQAEAAAKLPGEVTYLKLSFKNTAEGEEYFHAINTQVFRRLMMEELWHLADQDVADYVQQNWADVFEALDALEIENCDCPNLSVDDSSNYECKVQVVQAEAVLDPDGESMLDPEDDYSWVYQSDYAYDIPLRCGQELPWKCILNPSGEVDITWGQFDKACKLLGRHPLEYKQGFLCPESADINMGDDHRFESDPWVVAQEYACGDGSDFLNKWKAAYGDSKWVNWWHVTRMYLELYQTASQGKPVLHEGAHRLEHDKEAVHA